MIAVIFEVEIANGQQQAYLDIAAELLPFLEKIDGFISVERFQSLSNSGKILSLSFFQNEDSLKEWRQLQKHREAQYKGRNIIFKNYRLRIAGVIRNYGMLDREQAPADSNEIHCSSSNS